MKTKFRIYISAIVLIAAGTQSVQAAVCKVTKVTQRRKTYAIEHYRKPEGDLTPYADGVRLNVEGIKLYAPRQGEKYIVKWKTRKSQHTQGILKFDYITENSNKIFTKEIPVSLKNGRHSATIEHVGRKFFENGRILHWNVSFFHAEEFLGGHASSFWKMLPARVIERGEI